MAGLTSAAMFTRDARGQLAAPEELKHLKCIDGLAVELYAAEPLVVNPAAIDVDTHGRVWVAEIQHYRKAAKNPPDDSIKVLEDTDGDGQADKVTTFAEGLFCPMSICVAGSKVYVATSPDLWVFEDNDGDLKADGPPKKLLTGFGGHNHDHGAHSLVLGPDHKWWMSHGDQGFDVTGSDGSHIAYEWGAMLRGELDGSQLEIVARNFRNPYEICVSSYGEAFCSDNDNDGNQSTRICWILEGGDYGWFGRPPERVAMRLPYSAGWHFRAFQPGFVPGTLVTGFGSPCGICFYEGDALGPRFKNAPLHTDAGPREVRMYRHVPSGFGMKATSQVILTSDGDDYFRPDDICAAPDGSLYVSDWYDGGVGGHAYNNPTQGRIFRLTSTSRATGTKQPAPQPGPYTNVTDALAALANPNLATQFLAREYLLAHPEESQAKLVALVDDAGESADTNLKARALWVLDRLGGEARATVAAQLDRSDAALRALAVRILRRHGEEFAAAILAKSQDESAEVRREVLLTIARLKTPAAEKALVEIAAQYDGSDRYQLEAVNVAAGARRKKLYDALQERGGLALDRADLMQALDAERADKYLLAQLAADEAGTPQQPKIVERLATSSDPAVGRAFVKLLANSQSNPEARRYAFDVLAANLRGPWRDLLGAPELRDALRAMLADANRQVEALNFIRDNDIGGLDREILELVQREREPLAVRLAAMAAAARVAPAAASVIFEQQLNDSNPQIREMAMNSLVKTENWSTMRKLLTENRVSLNLQRGAVEQMLASTSGALMLYRLLDDSTLPQDLRGPLVARAANHADANVRTLFERFVPEDQRARRLGKRASPAEILSLEGNADRGERVFFKSTASHCSKCHRVNGVGGMIGPDLSQIGKKYDRGALLETILEPSKAIAPEYVPHLLETKSGKVYAGFLVEKSDELLVLKDADGKNIRVPADDVELLAPQTTSLMPELVLQDVSAQDAADLLSYLMSLKSN
ncbi:MAG: c-type cytochrome [Planctomycetaceae bacterium]|nr:c-type cytochrome [Planctomycetaceae bacterium]